MPVSDPDPQPIQTLTADLSGLPPGNDATFTVNGAHTVGTLTWTPTYVDAVGPYTVSFAAGNALSATKSVNFSSSNLALQLPDGATVGADDAPILIVDPGTTQQNQKARFTINDPTAGNYSLVLIDDSVTPHTRATLPLAVPSAGASAAGP